MWQLLEMWKNPNISRLENEKLNPAEETRLNTSPEQQFRKTRQSHAANSQKDFSNPSSPCVCVFLMYSFLLFPATLIH